MQHLLPLIGPARRSLFRMTEPRHAVVQIAEEGESLRLSTAWPAPLQSATWRASPSAWLALRLRNRLVPVVGLRMVVGVLFASGRSVGRANRPSSRAC